MKINGTKINISLLKTNIGLFDKEFTFEDHEKEIIEDIIEWLSYNCTENFIVTEIRSNIAAGGCCNNKEAFENGDFKLGRKNARRGELATEYDIRLTQIDVFAFRLRWIDETTHEDN